MGYLVFSYASSVGGCAVTLAESISMIFWLARSPTFSSQLLSWRIGIGYVAGKEIHQQATKKKDNETCSIELNTVFYSLKPSTVCMTPALCPWSRLQGVRHALVPREITWTSGKWNPLNTGRQLYWTAFTELKDCTRSQLWERDF